MPKYDFHCSSCDTTIERQVLSRERDEQVCACGRKLVRRFPTNISITIPEGFGEYTASCFQPKTDEEKSTWDRDGVTCMRGENSATSAILESATRAVGG